VFDFPFSLKEEAMDHTLRDETIATIQLAARKLAGFKRREFMAEMTLRFCDGSARKAETMFGWGRAAVNTGLNEKRTGIRCLDNFPARGRHKTEEQTPLLTEEIKRIVEPQSQADPKFQTTLAFTRITARAVRNELLKNAELKAVVPCRQIVGEILHRLGYRLRRVLKARPEKKFPRPTPSSPMSTPAGPRPGRTTRR
jgi:transposase